MKFGRRLECNLHVIDRCKFGVCDCCPFLCCKGAEKRSFCMVILPLTNTLHCLYTVCEQLTLHALRGVLIYRTSSHFKFFTQVNISRPSIWHMRDRLANCIVALSFIQQI